MTLKNSALGNIKHSEMTGQFLMSGFYCPDVDKIQDSCGGANIHFYNHAERAEENKPKRNLLELSLTSTG